MKVIEAVDYDDLSRRAAEIVVAQVEAKPASLLVLPTGETPLGLFRELLAARRSRAINFGKVHFVTLDEYAGIAANDRRRLLLWLKRELLDPLGVGDDRIHAFNPEAEPEAEATRIETVIAAHRGIDLAVLGLGPNGHLGFNEPGSAFDSRSRLVALTLESVRSNAAYWGTEADVPRSAFTLGLGTLGRSHSLLLLANGSRKAGILARALKGPISPDVPASVLRLHPDSIVITDRAAFRT